jgi:ribonucleoside-diphosphate reductase alpha chain
MMTTDRDVNSRAGDRDAIEFTAIAEDVLQKRYLARNYRGDIVERPSDMFHRVAHAVAEADRLYAARADVRASADAFEEAMVAKAFLPNSPSLMNAGRPMGQLAACFVLPLEDNLESIFDTLKNTALIHQTGGGTGFSFSRIRPSGDTIFPATGVAGGPLAFLSLFDNATRLIDRSGVRPGANMAVLNASHPDIAAFIQAKKSGERLCNFNLSVAMDEGFVRSVAAGTDYPLVHPRTGVVVKHLSSEAMLDMMARAAWETGDPGILFIDRINRDNPTPGIGFIDATNPCGEQPLLPYECCTLGSINLTQIVKGRDIDMDRLTELAHLGVHFLDNVIDVNRYPLRQIEEISRTNRKIGLGVMGFADMLILLNVPYQSPRALELAETIMAHIQASAEAASAELARRRGNFPAFDHSIFPARGIRSRRNATLTTIAPTGSISLIAGVSSGIEPVYSFRVKRRVVDAVHEDVHPLYARYEEQNLPIPENIFQTAYDVAPAWHLKIQAAFQQHTDNAVSKTVNMPQTATPEDIKQVFREAMELPVKGVTVYRDQSIEDQILLACSVKRAECS